MVRSGITKLRERKGIMFRELKEEPLWKLKRDRRIWRLVHNILPRAILAILVGILIAILILGLTEPRVAAAETMPAISLEVVKVPFNPMAETISEIVFDAESEIETESEKQWQKQNRKWNTPERLH